MKMVEANVLSSGPVSKCFKYLKQVYGTGNAALAKALKYLKRCSWVKLPEKRGQALLNVIVRRYGWVFGALVEQIKHREAVNMFGDVQSMYRQLKRYHGGNRNLLQVLSAEIVHFGKPAKTLRFN